MAPEVLIDDPDQPCDCRSDIYSLGCLLYRLVTGELLFDGLPEEVLEAHLSLDPLRKIQERYEIPLVFHDIMIKMLEKEPEKRYQTFDELADDIDHLIGGADSGINIQLIDQGTVIKGKYRLEEMILKLGGAHGPSPEKDLVLYSGSHLSTDTPVMLWFYRLPKSTDLDSAWNERLKAAAEYNHPSLLRVLDHGRDKGAYFFVSELRSQTITDYVDEHGPLSEMQAIDAARQIAEGLQYLNPGGYGVFGCLSPESVFIFSKPQLKVKLSGFERSVFYDTPNKLNRVEYLSPEQITGLGTLTSAVDIYAWGLLLYYMVAGKDLFQGEPHEIAGSHVFRDPKELLDETQLSTDFRRIVERAIKKDYTARYGSWQELFEDLDDYQTNALAPETEQLFAFIPGSASYQTVVGMEEDAKEEEVRSTFAMRYPPSNVGIRAAFAVASGIGTPEEALRCTDMALKESEKVFAYSSLSRLDILDDPAQLSITAMQRANGVVNQEAFRLNKIGSIGAELLIATIAQNRLILVRVGSGFAYLLRAATIRAFLRRPDERRILGRDLTVQTETAERQLRPGDVLILGTADLGRVLSDVEIRNCVTSTIDTQEACERIISLASSRYKGTGSANREGMACIVAQFGEISDSQFAIPGRFPMAPVIHHYVTKGTAYIEEGMWDKAISELQKAIEIKPDSFSANFQIALAYKEKGQLELALRHCKKSLDLFPGFAEGHIRLGDILYERGNRDRAREEFEIAVAAAPNSADAYSAFGTYYFKEALYSQAVRVFRRALELEPGNEQAKANLDMSLQRAKSITGAVAESASKVRHGIRRPFVQRKEPKKKKRR
jgi:serine/threonine protein kinase/serine/threonine protein phosphatase PrpC